MDGHQHRALPDDPAAPGKRWVTHAPHRGTVAEATQGPHLGRGAAERLLSGFGITRGSDFMSTGSSQRLVTLDGSAGEGGGQILRTALTLSLLTGRPFRLVKIRANRDKPGLRPQHLSAVKAAAELGLAEVEGAKVGGRDLTFRPQPYEPRDLTIDIGTAGSTALVLQTLHLPIALRAKDAVRVNIKGGTFNNQAPSYPFMETTWREHMARLGAPIALKMPSAGFYPQGGGEIDAWIEPAKLRPLTLTERGKFKRLQVIVGVGRIGRDVAARMGLRSIDRLLEHWIVSEYETLSLVGPSPGAMIAVIVSHEGDTPATFVALGERGKRAEQVTDEAVDEFLAYIVSRGSVDSHSGDQLMLPLALAPGRSEYTVSEVTDHLRTNAETIMTFLDRKIEIKEGDLESKTPGRVIIT